MRHGGVGAVHPPLCGDGEDAGDVVGVGALVRRHHLQKLADAVDVERGMPPGQVEGRFVRPGFTVGHDTIDPSNGLVMTTNAIDQFINP